MNESVTRRNFLSTTGTAALAAAGAAALGAERSGAKPLKILGVSCSPRKGMTTAASVQTALDAAKAVDSRIGVELIDLGGLFSQIVPDEGDLKSKSDRSHGTYPNRKRRMMRTTDLLVPGGGEPPAREDRRPPAPAVTGRIAEAVEEIHVSRHRKGCFLLVAVFRKAHARFNP